MRGAIQFNGNLAFHAEEIDNIPPNAVLPAEFSAQELFALKVLPQNAFCCGWILSQLFAAAF
jgi:hypothetical protein